MANYDLEAKITADASGYEAGVKKAEKASKKLSTSVSKVIQGLGKNGLVGALGAVGLASQGFTATLGAVVKIARRVSETMNECTNAYRSQLIAERSLNTAINNNPFVTGESSKALLQFASDMQKVSNYGDDELIPMMTNLISLGRTEGETMQIMSVAMDMSAGMGISLDSAITQLNATLNGSTGRLGQQNAELKGLTEEELEQGKAIEILGEKFKGLSSATVDTSKQLQNMKGDFKETLGEFTLPSNDLWNKFWTGFYERGIEVIGKFNSFLDAQIIGKTLAKNLEEQLSKLSYTGDRIRYMRDAFGVISDSELNALDDYLSGLMNLNEDQKQLLERVQLEKQRRIDIAEIEKQMAEESAKRKKAQEKEGENDIAKLKQKHLDAIKQKEAEWKYTEEITGKEVDSNEKLSFYQKDLIDIMTEGAGLITKDNEYYKQQIAIINDLKGEHIENNELQEKWNAKLLDQKIEMLETERDKAIELTAEEGKDTYSIMSDYNDKILELKLERLEREKEKALEEEGLTAEGKIFIEEYYKNEALNINEELKTKKKKKNEDEKKDEKNKFAIMLGYAKQYLEKMKQIFSKVVSSISKVVKSGLNFFKKLISINVNDILDTVLAFEDSVLTFFVETLPKLPKMIGSIIHSIQVLFQNLKANIKAETISDVVYNMLKQLSDSLPTLIDDLLNILTELLNGAVDGLIKWLDEDGLTTIFSLLLKIQKVAEDFVSNNLEKIVDMLSKHVDDIANFLAESMTSANKTLPKIIKAVTKFIITIIKIIGKIFENKEFVDSMVQAIIDIIKILLDNLPKLIDSLVTVIVSIIKALTPYLPKILSTLISAIFNAIPSVMDSLIKGFGEIFKTIFTAIFNGDFWKDVFGGIGEIFTNLFKKKDGAGGTEGYGSNSTGSTAGDIAVDFLVPFGFLRHFFADGTQNAPSGLSVVGEAGPELVRFRGGEQVINNKNTQKLLANANGSTNNFNVTFNNLQDTSAYAMMNELKQYNRAMAINGIL